jgi:hypothetical protein
MFLALFSGLALCVFLASIYPGTVTPEQASTLSRKQVEGMIRSHHIVAFRVLPLIAWVLLLVAFGIFQYRRNKETLGRGAEKQNP